MKPVLTAILILLATMTASASQPERQEARTDTLLKVRYGQGLAATRAGLYNDALRYWLEYLEVAESVPEKVPRDKVYTAYLAIGSIHFAFQDYESAVAFFRKGDDLAMKNGDKGSRLRFLNNLAGSYAELKEPLRADSCNEAMIKLADELKLTEYRHHYLFNKGYSARLNGDYPGAMKHMRASLRQMRLDSLPDSPAYAYSELYAIFEATGQLDSALYYLKRFQELADKPYLQLDCYKGLMRIYTKLGDNENSLIYQNRYFHLADSVLNSRDFLQTRNSYLFNEQLRTQRHIEGLEENLFRSRVGIMLISAVLILIVAVAVILLRQKKRLNSMNADLFERNRELVRLHDRLAEESRIRKGISTETEEKVRPVSEPADEPGADPEQKEEKEDPESRRRQDDLLARILDFMETSDGFLDPEFSLAQLAKEMESNTKYVSQVINERTGTPFRAFINEYRIKVARERMLDYATWGQMTIKSIGESVGFKSPANFIAAFKKGTGMTPSVYLAFARSRRAQASPDDSDDEKEG